MSKLVPLGLGVWVSLFLSFSAIANESTPEPEPSSCAAVISDATRLKTLKKAVAKEKLNLRQRIIFSLRPKKLNNFIQEEFHRRGIDVATGAEAEIKEAIAAGYDRAWESVKTSGFRVLNGLGLTGIGAGLFYFINKGLSTILGDAQAEAGAFFLGVVGAPLVASLSASLMEVIGSRLRNRSFKMKDFVSDVIAGAKPRLQDLYFFANASMPSTQQAGRMIQTDLDTNFTDKIRWASENILKFLESGLEIRRTKAVEVVAMALIKLRENYPDMMQAILTGKDETLLREPRRILGGLLRESEIKIDQFYKDVLKVVHEEDPQAANKEVAEAFETILGKILEPLPKPKKPIKDEINSETGSDTQEAA